MKNNKHIEISKLDILHNLKFYLILANISIILLFYSFWQIKPIIVDVNDFLGLTSHLTIYYWIGLILITLCSILIYLYKYEERNYIFILILVYFGIFLFGIPTFVEDNARGQFSYYPAGEVKNVLDTGFIDTTSRWALMSYRSWPGIHMESSFILAITNVQFESMIKYMPIFWLLSMIFLVFSIGKSFRLSSGDSFVATFIFLASFWTPQYYYGGQSLAIIGFLSLFMLANIRESVTKIPNMILFSFLTITHFLTSVIYLTQMFAQMKLKNYSRELIILFFMIFTGWLIYLTPRVLEFGIDRFIEQVSGNILYWEGTQKFEPVTQMRTTINNFRLSYLLIYGIFLFMVCLFYFFGKIDINRKNEINKIFPWLIVMTPFIFVKYGPEVFERVYIFSLVPVVYIILLGISNKKMLSVLMVLVIILFIPSQYGDEITWQTPTSELKGAEFFASKYPYDAMMNKEITKGIKPKAYYGRQPSYIWYSNPDMIKIPAKSFPLFDKPGENIDSLATSILYNTSYVLDNKKMRDAYTFYYGFNPIEGWVESSHYDLIYQNKDFQIMKVIRDNIG